MFRIFIFAIATASLVWVQPAVAKDEGLAAHIYFKMPLEDTKARLDDARLGFRLEQETLSDDLDIPSLLSHEPLSGIAPLSGGDPLLTGLPLMDFSINGRGLARANLLGIDALKLYGFLSPEAPFVAARRPAKRADPIASLLASSTDK